MHMPITEPCLKWDDELAENTRHWDLISKGLLFARFNDTGNVIFDIDYLNKDLCGLLILVN